MLTHDGGCLCGANRFQVSAAPARVTVCHCKFCQRATGGAFMVEPVFARSDVRITRGRPATYDHRSEGSGKIVEVNFCPTCGTKLLLGFERFPDVLGIYGGTFDDPDWFDRTPDNTRHIFLGAAQRGTVIPAGFNTFRQHASDNDGMPPPPHVFTEACEIG